MEAPKTHMNDPLKDLDLSSEIAPGFEFDDSRFHDSFAGDLFLGVIGEGEMNGCEATGA